MLLEKHINIWFLEFNIVVDTMQCCFSVYTVIRDFCSTVLKQCASESCILLFFLLK